MQVLLIIYLVSHSLFFNIVDFQVLETDLFLSDRHSPLNMHLQINKCKHDAHCLSEQATVSIENDHNFTGNSKVIWRKDSKLTGSAVIIHDVRCDNRHRLLSRWFQLDY